MLAEPLTFYYPTGQDSLARWIFQSINKAGKLLTQLLDRPLPEMKIILAAPTDWSFAPREDPEEPHDALPYWTNATQPPSIVVPSQLDPIIGMHTQEKLAFLLYAALTQAFLEHYRNDFSMLLSDDVTAMLASSLGPGGSEWLEDLVYF